MADKKKKNIKRKTELRANKDNPWLTVSFEIILEKTTSCNPLPRQMLPRYGFSIRSLRSDTNRHIHTEIKAKRPAVAEGGGGGELMFGLSTQHLYSRRDRQTLRPSDKQTDVGTWPLENERLVKRKHSLWGVLSPRLHRGDWMLAASSFSLPVNRALMFIRQPREGREVVRGNTFVPEPCSQESSTTLDMADLKRMSAWVGEREGTRERKRWATVRKHGGERRGALQNGNLLYSLPHGAPHPPVGLLSYLSSNYNYCRGDPHPPHPSSRTYPPPTWALIGKGSLTKCP